MSTPEPAACVHEPRIVTGWSDPLPSAYVGSVTVVGYAYRCLHCPARQLVAFMRYPGVDGDGGPAGELLEASPWFARSPQGVKTQVSHV
jgi:hypothetical protein